MAYEKIETIIDTDALPPIKSPVEPNPGSTQIILDEEGKDKEQVQVEVVDDTPPEDQGRRRRQPGEKPYDVSDDEIAKYDESVQQRIKKLRYEFHEERRQKDEAGRRESAAVDYARKVLAENARLKGVLEQGEKTLLEQAKARAKAQSDRAKQALHEAYAAQDPEKISAASEALARSTAELSQIEAMPLQYTGAGQAAQEDLVAAEKVFQARPKQQQGPDPRALDWASKNTWFGKDAQMTWVARGLDAHLLQNGHNPRTNPEAYYAAIDAGMRQAFPDRFRDGSYTPQEAAERTPQRSAAEEAPKARVAPTVRTPSGSGTPTQVRLTKSQVEIARRLGLKLEDYAQQLRGQDNG